jgi:flagellar biogenesis protein FliO
MALFFVRMILLMVILIGFGSWGIRKFLNQNPKVKGAITDGIVSRITRFFM